MAREKEYRLEHNLDRKDPRYLDPFGVRKDLMTSGTMSAYKNVIERIDQVEDDRVKSGDGLIENLLHEKAQELSRFGK